MGGYLSILLLLSLGLWVPPLVSSCKGTIHFRNADGEKVTVVENAPLTLEVHVNFTCNEEVTNLRVALSKKMKSGRYIDVCSVHQIGEQCSSRSKDACDCLEGDRETGRLYKFQRTARLQDSGQWRVKAEGNVRAEAFITLEVQEPSSAAPTTNIEGTTVPDEKDEKTTMASGGSTKTDNAQDTDTLDFEEEGSTQPLIASPDRSLSEEMIHPFFTSIFGYGTLGLLGLALLFIFIVTIVIITRKGKREKSPKKAKQRQKPRPSSDVMSIQSSDAGYDTISASGASVLYDDIVLDRHAAEEAHLRVQRPLPPVPLSDYLTPVASESELPPVSHQLVFRAGHYFNVN